VRQQGDAEHAVNGSLLIFEISLFFAGNSLFLRNSSLLPNRPLPRQSAVKWHLFR
jgi:hypothetical protein